MPCEHDILNTASINIIHLYSIILFFSWERRWGNSFLNAYFCPLSCVHRLFKCMMHLWTHTFITFWLPSILSIYHKIYSSLHALNHRFSSIHPPSDDGYPSMKTSEFWTDNLFTLENALRRVLILIISKIINIFHSFLFLLSIYLAI